MMNQGLIGKRVTFPRGPDDSYEVVAVYYRPDWWCPRVTFLDPGGRLMTRDLRTLESEGAVFR